MSAERPVRLVVTAHAVAAVVLALVVLLLVGSIAADESLADGLPYLLLLVVTLVTGWMLAVRVPRNAVGWLLMAVPGLFLVPDLVGVVGDALREAAPGVAVWFEWYSGTDAVPSWSWVPPVWLLLCQLPLHFPTGHLPSPRWRRFQVITVLALVLECAVIGVSPQKLGVGLPNPVHVAHVPEWVDAASSLLLASCVLVSIVSLVVRGRHATALVRAQLRWILWSVLVALLGLLTSWLIGVVLDLDTHYLSWLLILYALIPVAIGVAVLRYRLYEIDRLISRTAAYAVVTAITIGTYALVVLLASLVLGSSGGVAAGTLAAAGVFLPLLRWVRRGIDRVFNRAQYDAERVVAAFGERIRNGADPHTAGADLLTAVGDTLQPAALGLWVPRSGS